MNSLHTPRRLTVISILSLLGAIGAGYLSKVYYDLRSGTAGFKSLCNLGDKFNCDAVAASTHAELMNGLPLSSVVAGWMLAILLVSLIARNFEWRRDAIRVGSVLSLVAVLISGFYLYVMMSVVKTFCIVCIGLDVATIATLILFLSLKPEPLSKAPFNRGQLTTWITIPVACVLVMLVVLRGFQSQDVSAEMIRDAAQSVMSAPKVAVGGGPEFPTIGKADAPVTIVEFSDLQCPACRAGAMILNTVLQRHPDDVKVVFRAFPLDSNCNRKVQSAMHPAACEASKVLFCAAEQGKFKPVYEAIFDRQAELVPGKAAEIAASLGVDRAALDACVVKPETTQKLTRDIEDGINLNVQSTPTFYINGRRVEGAYPLPVWSKIIEQLKNEAR